MFSDLSTFKNKIVVSGIEIYSRLDFQYSIVLVIASFSSNTQYSIITVSSEV